MMFNHEGVGIHEHHEANLIFVPFVIVAKRPLWF